ncbi:MAG: hypothetical protein C4516_09690 [Oxalobacter sp.]|nr:MAG: hypothetical protein C4516_09690 [Oxalobacter sp.]
MRYEIKLCLLALLTLSLPAWSNEKDALKDLNHAAPHVQWEAKGAIEIDIDCDNHKDYVMLKQADGKVSVGMVLGRPNNPKVYVTDIALGNGKNELCIGTASILAESLDYNPKYVTGKAVEGFKRSRCRAFRVASAKCEPFHFYWNTQQNRPAWWRRAK